MLLAVGGIIYLAMPRMIFDTYMADQRLPISLAFMMIACANLNLRQDHVRRGFATVLVLLILSLGLDWYGPFSGFNSFEFLDLLLVSLALVTLVVLVDALGVLHTPLRSGTPLVIALFLFATWNDLVHLRFFEFIANLFT